MTDAVDIANELNERLVSAELAEMRRRNSFTLPQPLPEGGELKAGESQKGLTDHHCIDCGETISEGRLIAMPYAVRCINCQNELEMG